MATRTRVKLLPFSSASEGFVCLVRQRPSEAHNASLSSKGGGERESESEGEREKRGGTEGRRERQRERKRPAQSLSNFSSLSTKTGIGGTPV